MLTIEGDRRMHPRLPVTRPCKIYDPHTGKYIGGNTQDVSSGGVLIELSRLTHLKPGDTLHIGVALKRRDALIHASDMLKAAVKRVVQTVDDRMLLGLQFEQPVEASTQPMLAAA